MMVARNRQHSKDWKRPSPTQGVHVPRYKRYSTDWKRPSPRLLSPRYKRTSMDWERPFSTQRLHVPWYRSRLLVPQYKRHLTDWERPSQNQRQLVPWYERRSMDWKRPSPNQRQLVPRYNRRSLDWERPLPTPKLYVHLYDRHAMDWKMPPPTPWLHVSQHHRYSMDSVGPSPIPWLFAPQDDRYSMDSEGPSPIPRMYVNQYDRHSMDSKRPLPVHRHSMVWKRPSQTPRLSVPQDNQNFIQRSMRHDVQSTGSIVYPDHAVFRWFATGLDGDNQFPSSVSLEPISLESMRKTLKKPFVLVKSHLAKDQHKEEWNISGSPWESVAQHVWPDLLSCLEIVRSKMKTQEVEEVKPKLVARFGRVIFYGNSSRCLDNVRESQLSETTLGKMKKLFYTNVPASHMEKIIGEVVQKLKLILKRRRIYTTSGTRPDSIISCKCGLNEDKKLELYKVKLIHQLRHMVIDISCLSKDVDLRLMLSRKRILTALTDDEMQRISSLINLAVLDPDVKGGLRWPQAACSQSRGYNVVGAWHTISKLYKSPSLILEVRHADRYNFETASGEATTEISLKLKGLVSELLAQKLESNSIYNMFKDTLGMIWHHFLCLNTRSNGMFDKREESTEAKHLSNYLKPIYGHCQII